MSEEYPKQEKRRFDFEEESNVQVSRELLKKVFFESFVRFNSFEYQEREQDEEKAFKREEYMVNVIVSRLDKIFEGLNNDEKIEAMEIIASGSFILPLFVDLDKENKKKKERAIKLKRPYASDSRSGFEIESSACGKLEARFGKEIGIAVLRELVRAQLLISTAEYQRKKEFDEFGRSEYDISLIYAGLLKAGDELKISRGIAEVQRFSEISDETFISSDPELFIDQMIIRASFEDSSLDFRDRLSRMNNNFSKKFLASFEGFIYRTGRKNEDIALFKERIKIWEEKAGEKIKTREDLIDEAERLQKESVDKGKKLAEKEMLLAEKEDENRDLLRKLAESAEKVDESDDKERTIRILLEREKFKSGELIAENKALLRENRRIGGFLLELLQASRDNDSFLKRGNGFEVIKKMLEDEFSGK